MSEFSRLRCFYVCVYASVCVHISEAVAGIVDWEHKCKMRSVNENWKLSKKILLDVQKSMISWRWKIDMWGKKQPV